MPVGVKTEPGSQMSTMLYSQRKNRHVCVCVCACACVRVCACACMCLRMCVCERETILERKIAFCLLTV